MSVLIQCYICKERKGQSHYKLYRYYMVSPEDAVCNECRRKELIKLLGECVDCNKETCFNCQFQHKEK